MKIAIIGQGGHSKVIQDMLRENLEFKIIGFFDDKYKDECIKEGIYFGPIISVLKLLRNHPSTKLVIAIGNNKIRKQIVDQLVLPPEQYVSVIHSTAIVSPSVKIGHGTVIMPKAVVNADSLIGDHCIINTNAIVEHDNKLENFIHVSPNATLTGGVNVDEGTHIGAGATIIPNIHIGEWAVVGAGATVVRDIPSYSTAVGVPAKVKKIIGGVYYVKR
jgi:acetyltransferase EpsM